MVPQTPLQQSVFVWQADEQYPWGSVVTHCCPVPQSESCAQAAPGAEQVLPSRPASVPAGGGVDGVPPQAASNATRNTDASDWYDLIEGPQCRRTDGGDSTFEMYSWLQT